MRILAFSNSPLDPTLGSGKTVINWLNGLKRHGHAWNAFPDGILPHSLRRWPGRRFFTAIMAWQVLRDQLPIVKPDLVEFYGGEFGLATYFASDRRPRPLLVAHTNGLELLAHEALALPPRWTGFLHRKLDRAAFVHADRFVGLCELDRDYIVSHGILPRERTAVIEPGLDEPYLAQVAASDEGRDHAVAFTGSWVPRKDPASIVAVMEPLLLADAKLRFHVFGAAGAEAAIRAAFSLAVQTQLHIAGKLSTLDLAAQLARCQVFFFPSRYEGYGMAITEAMACGCAVVTTPTGVGAMLRDGEEARICGFGDRAAMGAAIRELLQEEPQRRRLVQAGRQRAAALTWPAQVSKLNDLYTGWVAEHTRAMAGH